MILLYLYILSGIFSVVSVIWVRNEKEDITVSHIPVLLVIFLLNPIFVFFVCSTIAKKLKLKNVVLIKKRGSANNNDNNIE